VRAEAQTQRDLCTCDDGPATECNKLLTLAADAKSCVQLLDIVDPLGEANAQVVLNQGGANRLFVVF